MVPNPPVGGSLLGWPWEKNTTPNPDSVGMKLPFTSEMSMDFFSLRFNDSQGEKQVSHLRLLALGSGYAPASQHPPPRAPEREAWGRVKACARHVRGRLGSGSSSLR